MGKKLYVGNLSYTASEDGLKQVFAEVGNVVSVSIVKNRDTGQSRGFGFVEMDTDEAAQAAISNLNGADFMGRKLNISEAREGGGGGGGGGGGRGGPRRDFRGGGGGGGGGFRRGGGDRPPRY